MLLVRTGPYSTVPYIPFSVRSVQNEQMHEQGANPTSVGIDDSNLDIYRQQPHQPVTKKFFVSNPQQDL